MTSTHNAPIRDVYRLDRTKVADDMIIRGKLRIMQMGHCCSDVLDFGLLVWTFPAAFHMMHDPMTPISERDSRPGTTGLSSRHPV
jgi:hypothetical protein